MKGELVIGAILGDILGSPYEGLPKECCNLNQDFSEDRRFTDDTILTIATMECMLDDSEEFEKYYMKWGRRFRDEDIWGRSFANWLDAGDCKIINHSWGNGCLMRISPVAYYPGTEEECKRLAIISCQYTHNYPESFLAAIKYVSVLYRYLHNMPIYDIQNNYDYYLNHPTGFNCSVDSVKQAYSSFLKRGSIEGNFVTNAINNAICLGGDTDTIGAMTGALIETIFPVEDHYSLIKDYLPKDMMDIVKRFSKRFNSYKEIDICV